MLDSLTGNQAVGHLALGVPAVVDDTALSPVLWHTTCFQKDRHVAHAVHAVLQTSIHLLVGRQHVTVSRVHVPLVCMWLEQIASWCTMCLTALMPYASCMLLSSRVCSGLTWQSRYGHAKQLPSGSSAKGSAPASNACIGGVSFRVSFYQYLSDLYTAACVHCATALFL